jgi:SAM-dependent methyltransferase
MKIAETDILRSYFPEKLDSKNYHYYIPRKSILDFLRSNSSQFKGCFVDLGCGFMPYRRMIESSVQEYIGIDIENSDIYTADNIVFWDGKTIPLENESVDVLLSTELLEHVEFPKDISKEVFRVLKPGGIWLGTIPFVWSVHEVPHDWSRYTPFALSDIIQHPGFSVGKISALGGMNASLALMLGLWLESQSPAKRWVARMKRNSILYWMRRLIQTDNKHIDIFSNTAMFSGLGWIANKPGKNEVD